MRKRIILGTRGSALALAQVRLVEQALRASDDGIETDVKTITTTGDRRQDPSFKVETRAGLKGLFTKEIQDALLAGEIDAAVHSLKDVPGVTPAELMIASVLERAPASDLLIAKTASGFDELPAGAKVGTSSVRRSRMLRWRRPDLHIEPLRGNVPTRLQKLRDSENLDAIVLAFAGLHRLGFHPSDGSLDFEGTTFRTEILTHIPHAIGQGAIGLECRADDAATRSILEKINHAPTFTCVRAERELLRLLDGDCTLPVGVRTQLLGGKLLMEAMVFGDENTEPKQARNEGDGANPEALAQQLFRQLYS